MRTNKTIIQAIVGNIVKDTIDKRVAEATAHRDACGDKIVDEVMKFDGMLSVVSNAPLHYYPKRTRLAIRITDELQSGIQLHASSGVNNSRYLYVDCSFRPLYEQSPFHAFHVIAASEQMVKDYQEAEAKLGKLQQERTDAYSHLYFVLSNFKTTEAIIKELPDFEQYIPEQYIGKQTTALAVRPEEITNFVKKLAA